MPDAQAEGVLIEVETEDSIENAHTKDQWTLFSAYALEEGLSFRVAVSSEAKQTAKARVQEFRVDAEVWGLCRGLWVVGFLRHPALL